MTLPPAPPPDDKDWTWVLERPCPECGFDASTLTGREVPDRLRSAIATLRSAVLAPEADLRPSPTVWSALEYGCHVRDVCIVMGARLAVMRHDDNPEFANWDQDQTALDERYASQDRRKVADELSVEAERIAGDLERVRDDQWSRPGRRSNGSVFTVDTLARYFLHDVVHHVHDVTGR